MYIATGQGQTTPGDKILMTTETSCHFGHLLWSLILYSFFMILYMYTAAGQGLISPWGRNFDVNRNILSLLSFVASLKKNLFSVWFYTIFFLMILYMYIAPGQGQTAHRGQSFNVNRKVLSLRNLFEVWFYTIFFMILYVYIAPGQGLTTPWGWNFDVNRNILSLRSFVASFKKISWKSDFIKKKFHDFIHVYSPGAGADSPQGTKFWFQQKCLVTSFICCKFKKNAFEVWF